MVFTPKHVGAYECKFNIIFKTSIVYQLVKKNLANYEDARYVYENSIQSTA